MQNNLRPDFEVLSSEVGLKIGKNSRRAADIAIYEKANLKKIKDESKILEIPPKYVIEVDIKAAKEDIEDSTSYYHHKTDELLSFGVEYIVWIFTNSKKVQVKITNTMFYAFELFFPADVADTADNTD